MLRERIGDLVPGRLRADEDMEHRKNARIVDQGPERDVKELAVAHEGEGGRAAQLAEAHDVVRVLLEQRCPRRP